MQAKIGTSNTITDIAQLLSNPAIATSVSHTQTTTGNYQHPLIASTTDQFLAKDIPKPYLMQGHPHDTNNTQNIIHQLHGHQPKPSLSTTPKPIPVHLTQVEFMTTAPHQLPCTLNNSNSLNQTQQCLQNSPNCVPEPLWSTRLATPFATCKERPEWMGSSRRCWWNQLGGTVANCSWETTTLSYAKMACCLLLLSNCELKTKLN